MAIQTAYTKHMGKVGSYLKNVGKSVGYASIDVLKGVSPSTAEFAETNRELFKDVYSATTNYRQTIKQAEVSIKGSKLYAAVDDGFKNLKSDLRTGKLYNRKREEDYNLKASGEDFSDGGDWGMDWSVDFDSDDDAPPKPKASQDNARAEFMVKSFDGSVLAGAEMTANAVTRSAEFSVAAGKANTKLLYTQNLNMMSAMTTGFTSIKMGLDAINASLAGPMQTHMENSKTFYETNTKINQENNAILKEMLEMQRNLYKAKEQEYRTSAYDNITGAEGTPDLREYAKQVKKNLKTVLGPEFETMFGDSMGENSNLLLAFVGSPLKFLPTMLVKTVIPATIRASMKSIDEGMSTFFSNFIARMNSNKNSENVILRGLGAALGINIDSKKTVDPSKFNKGNMTWNGIAQKTLVDVIPGHLRRIESLLGGGEERLFDYNSGKWKKQSQARKEYDEINSNAIRSATSEITEIAVKAIKDLQVKSYDSQQDMIETFNNFAKQLYKDGGGLRFEKRNSDNDKYRRLFGDDNFYEYIMQTLSMPNNRGALRRLDGNIFNAKQNVARQNREIETNGGHLLSLFDGSEFKKGKVAPGIVDKSGHDSLFYLRKILGELMYQREVGIGGRSKGRGRKSSIKLDDNFINSRLGSIQVEEDSEEKRIAERIDREKKNYKGGTFNPNAGDAQYYYEAQLRAYQDKINKSKPDSGEYFLDQLLNANSIGAKFGVMGKGLKNLKSAPANALNSIITTADRRLFDIMFNTKNLGLDEDMKDAKGRKINGLVDLMISRTTDSFDKLNDYLDDHILNPLKKKLEPFWNKLKTFAQPYGEAIKNKFSWAKGKVTGAMGRAYGPIFDKLKSGEVVSAYDANIQDPDNVMHSAHGRFVSKYGLTMVSPGELIIPSSSNKSIQNRQLQMEKREKNKIMRAISRGQIAHNAQGGFTSDFMNPNSDTVDASGFRKASVKDTAMKVAASVSGKSQEEVQKLMGSISKNAPDVLSSGVLGGALGLLVGGPLFGAAAGVATSIVTKNKTMQGILFGSEENDDGLFSKDLQNKVKAIAGDLETYGIAGAVTGLITPLGPIGGLMVGSAIAYAKNNADFMEKIFGKLGDDGERDSSGMIKPGLVNKLKKAAPKMGIGAVAGMMVGPFGLLGNLVLGSGLGYASTTSKFQEMILGKEDDKGNRTGGLAGAIKTSVVDPLKEMAIEFKDQAKDYIKDHMLKPLGDFAKPFTQMMKNTVEGIGEKVTDTLNGIFERTIGVPLTEAMENLMGKMTNIAGKVFKAAIFVPKTVLTAPFKILGGIGNTIRNSQINRGTANDMTASERLAFRAQHGIRSGFSRWTGADKTLELDQMMANMDGTKTQALHDAVGQYVDQGKWSDTRRRDTINKSGAAIRDFLDTNKTADGKSLYDTIGYTGAKEIRRAAASGDANLFRQSLGAYKGKNGVGLSAQQQDALFNQMKGSIGDIKNYTNMKGVAAKSREDLEKEISGILGTNITGKGIKHLYKNLGREIKVDKDGIGQVDFENEDMAKLSSTLQNNANKTADRMVDSFSTTNKLLKMIASHLTGEKIDIGDGDKKTTKVANQIDKSDQKVEKIGRQAMATDEVMKASANMISSRNKSKLAYTFGDGFTSTIADLGNLPNGRLNKVIAVNAEVNSNAVDFLLQLNDQEFDMFYKVAKSVRFKLDINTCELIRKKLNKKSVELIQKTAKAGFVIKNSTDLIGVMNNIKSNEQVKNLKVYIKVSGITPQTVADLVKATANTNLIAGLTKDENPTKVAKAVKETVEGASDSSVTGGNDAVNAAGAMKAGSAIKDKVGGIFSKAKDKFTSVISPRGRVMTLGPNNEPLDDKQSQLGKSDFEEDADNKKRLADSSEENATGIKGFVTKFFGNKKNQDDEKEGLFNKLIKNTSGMGGGIGKILKFLGMGVTGAVAISATGHASQFFKTAVWPTFEEKILPKLSGAIIGTVDENGNRQGGLRGLLLGNKQADGTWDETGLFPKLGEKIEGIGEKITGTIQGMLDWFRGGGMGDLFVNVLIPKFLDGFAYFNENLLAPLTATIIRALPSIAVGIVKGIKSVFSVNIFNRKLSGRDKKIEIDLSGSINDANNLATSDTRSRVSGWLTNLSSPKPSVSNKTVIDLSDMDVNTKDTRKTETSNKTGIVAQTKNLLGLNRSTNQVEFATDENGNILAGEDGRPIPVSDYYATSAKGTIAGTIAKGSVTSFLNHAAGSAATKNIGNVLTKVSVKGAAKGALDSAVSGKGGIIGKGIGMAGNIIKGTVGLAGKAVEKAGELGTKVGTWAAKDGAKAVVTEGAELAMKGSAKAVVAEGAKTGLLATIKKKITSTLTGFATDGSIMRFFRSAAKWGFGKEIGETVITKAFTAISNKLVSAIGANVASSALAKMAAGLASMSPAALILDIGRFLWGYNNANTIFGVAEPLGPVYGIIAGFAMIINEHITFGLIPLTSFVDILMEHILPLFGLTDTELQQKRDDATRILDEWNAANPDNTFDNIEDYNNRNKLTTKVGNALLGKKNAETGKREGGLIGDGVRAVGNKVGNALLGEKNAETGKREGGLIVDGVKAIGASVSGFAKDSVGSVFNIGKAIAGIYKSAIDNKPLTEIFGTKPEETGNPVLDGTANAALGVSKVTMFPIIMTAKMIGMVKDPIINTVKAAAKVIPSLAGSMKNLFANAFDASSNPIDIYGTKLVSSGDESIDNITGNIFAISKIVLTAPLALTKAAGLIAAGVGKVIGAAKTLIPAVGTSVGDMFKNAASSVNLIQTYSTEMTPTGDPLMDKIGGAIFGISKIVLTPQILITTAVGAIARGIGVVVDSAKILLPAVGTSVGDMFKNAASSVNLVETYSTEMESTGDPLMDKIGGVVFGISKIALTPQILITTAVGAIARGIGTVIDAAKTLVPALGTSVGSYWGNITDGSASLGQVFGTELSDTGHPLLNGLGNVAFGAFKIATSPIALTVHAGAVIANKVSGVIDTVKKLKDGMDASDKSKIEALMDGSAKLDSDFWKNADYTGNPLGGLINAATSIAKVMAVPMMVIHKIFDPIGDAINKVKNGIVSKAQDLWGFLKGTDNDDSTGTGRRKSYGYGRVYQEDPSISDMKFGSGSRFNTIGNAGCGPVAATNLINDIGGSIDINSAAQHAVQNGFKARNGGTNINYFNSILGSSGYNTSNSSNANQIRSSIRNGKPVVLLGNDGTLNGPFGDRNHFITAKGYDGRGNIIVDDPDNPNGNLVYPEKQVLSNTHDSVIVNGYGKSNRYRSGSGSGFGTAYPKYQLSDYAKKELAALIAGESGSSDIVANMQEASQIANLSEVQKGQPSTEAGILKTAKGNWYAKSSWTRGRKANLTLPLQAVESVLVNGQRTLPRYVVEHDWFPNDILNAKNRDAYKFGDDVANKYGSKYKFYTFFGKDKQGDIAGYFPKYYDKYKDDQPYGGSASSVPTSSDGSTTESAETQSPTLNSVLGDLGKSMVKGIYGDDAYSFMFGNDSSSSSASADASGQTSSGPADGKLETFVQKAIAEDGYKEKKSNSNLDDKEVNAGSANYTKYGKHFGMNGVPWCAQFVSWAADAAGIPQENVPRTSEVSGFLDYYRKRNQLKGPNTTPSRGDILIMKGAGSSHTGIVTGMDAGKIKTIEGNTSNRVAQRSYTPGDKRITGFGDPKMGKATGTSGMTGTTSTTNAFGRRKSKYGFGRSIQDADGHENTDKVLRSSGLLEKAFTPPAVNVMNVNANNAGTGRRKSGFGSTDYTNILASVVNILLSIANNTQVLNNIMALLSDKLGVQVSSSDVQKLVSSTQSTDTARAQLMNMLGNQSGSSQAGVLNNSSTQSLVQVMQAIAAQ